MRFIDCRGGYVAARQVVAIRDVTKQERNKVEADGMLSAIDTTSGKTYFDDRPPAELLEVLEGDGV